MRLVIRKRNEEKSNSCRSTEKLVVALGGYQWNGSVSYIVLFHWQPLEAIFISSGSQLRKKGWTQRASGPAKSDPRLLPFFKRGSGVSPLGRFIYSRHNIKKVASGWNRKRGPSLDKIMKMDHDNLRKILHWQASWQTKPKQEGSRTIRKQQSRMSGLEWDPSVQWKASPMMKNQTAKIEKVKSW